MTCRRVNYKFPHVKHKSCKTVKSFVLMTVIHVFLYVIWTFNWYETTITEQQKKFCTISTIISDFATEEFGCLWFIVKFKYCSATCISWLVLHIIKGEIWTVVTNTQLKHKIQNTYRVRYNTRCWDRRVNPHKWCLAFGRNWTTWISK